MGYYSVMTVALSATVVNRNIITNEIPKLLLDTRIAVVTDYKHHSTGELYARYYQLEPLKFYADIPDIAGVHAFFEQLDDEKTDETLYGALMVGEDHNDTHSFGDPDSFELFFTTIIEIPR